jgi:hypothetical protein
VPSSLNRCDVDPPIVPRFPVTVIAVLEGLVPGVTVTTRSAVPPGETDEGLAVPVPVGFVGFAVPAVVNVESLPWLVPALLVATRRKW